MKKYIIFAAIAVLLTTVSFGVGDVSAQTKRKPTIKKKVPVKRTPAKPTVKLYSVAQGTRFRVRMNDKLTSKTAKVGDTFTVTVTEPVYSTSGVVVIPVGSTVTGKVSTVTSAKKGGKVGEIDVNFIQVVLPNGSKRAINGSLTELSADDAKSDPEGTAKGDKMAHRKVIFIGGGGAGGAVLGGVVGGGKGALIGGILGAGAGLLGERLTKGEDVEVKAGEQFGIYLNRAISLPRFIETED